MEIKNLVKMFEPKALNQAYNLARLQDNTLAYRRSYQNYTKFVLLNTNQTTQSKPSNNQTPYKISPTLNTSNLKQRQNSLLPTPNSYFQCKPTMRPTKSVRNKELDERKAKGLCFWCDERFVLDHKCKNKKSNFLYMVDDDGKEVECKTREQIMQIEGIYNNLNFL